MRPRVWYVSYGSNLALSRFRCYLAGGTPAGGRREYVGCRDGRDPLATLSFEAPGGLLFGGSSTVWGGGIASYDPERPGLAACRGYLVTVEQFADVVAQEMRRPVGGGFAQRMGSLLPAVTSSRVIGPGRYETLIKLGTRDGFPMLTVTHEHVAALDVAPPSEAYLRCICAGLHEAHLWDGARIAGYLAAAAGMSPGWTREAVVALARSSLE